MFINAYKKRITLSKHKYYINQIIDINLTLKYSSHALFSYINVTILNILIILLHTHTLTLHYFLHFQVYMHSALHTHSNVRRISFKCYKIKCNLCMKLQLKPDLPVKLFLYITLKRRHLASQHLAYGHDITYLFECVLTYSTDDVRAVHAAQIT